MECLSCGKHFDKKQARVLLERVTQHGYNVMRKSWNCPFCWSSKVNFENGESGNILKDKWEEAWITHI